MQANKVGSDIWEILYRLAGKRSDVLLHWVPGHAGLTGNEMADRLANEASSMPQLNIPLSKLTANTAVRESIREMEAKRHQKPLADHPPDIAQLTR